MQHAMQHTIDRWLATYSEPEAATRRAAIVELWNPEGSLLEPPLDGHGHDGIDNLAQALQAHYSGHRFVRTTEIDEHHGAGRYGWQLIGPDGTPTLHGVDIVRTDGDGRLREIIGFFGDTPTPI